MSDISHIHDLSNRYKQGCHTYVFEPPNKLPIQLRSKEDTAARLAAFYEIFVEQRGHMTQWDDTSEAKLNDVTNWLHDSPQRGLLLYGSLGNGKTTMLQSLAKLFLGKAILASAKRIYDQYKSEERIPFPRDKILLIDDLGTEPERCLIYGEEHHPLTNIFTERYDTNSTTIIATNLSVDDIRARYGDRVYDRMIEMYTGILYDTPSYRLQF